MAPTESAMPYSSLQPLPVGSRKPKNLAEFITRVQNDRGFRNVTEAGLREDIQSQAQADENKDVEMTGADEAEAEEEGKEDAKEVKKDMISVKGELLKNVDTALNASALCLDLVSLILSKQSPNQAGATLSPLLRELAGIGTLGVSKFKDSSQQDDKRKREEKRHEARELSLGWTIMDVAKIRKAAEMSYTALSKEAELESKYWNEILGVKQNGWSVCRLPIAGQPLGVRFGFTEASPEFKNHSLAPLKRGEDGSVVLEQARSGDGCQRISIALSRDDEQSGRSQPNSAVSDTAPLQDRVLEARNTVFSQELWHELHREARSLASYRVRSTDTHIVYEPESGPRVAVALETLPPVPSSNHDLPDNKLAEFTQLSLHLLLSFAHRQNEFQRLRPGPPHQRRLQQFQQHHLLRPLISRTTHDLSVQRCTKLVGNFIRILRQAGIKGPSFTLRSPKLSVVDLMAPTSSSNRPTAAQALISHLMAPADFQVEMNITPKSRIQILGRTWFLPITTTQYQVNLLAPADTTDPMLNPLHASCPPYRERDGYPNLTSLMAYLISAVPRAIVDEHFPSARFPADAGDANPGWTKTISGNAVRHSSIEPREVRFDIVENNKDSDAENRLALVVSASWQVDDRTTRNTWTFNGEGSAEISVDRILHAVASSSKVS